MNLRLIVLAGLALYVMTWVPSFVSGPLIHEGVPAPAYRATASFWRPAVGGTGFLRGAKFGLLLWLFAPALMGSWISISDLPDRIWFWWMGEFAVSMAVCGGVLGWVADRWCGPAASA